MMNRKIFKEGANSFGVLEYWSVGVLEKNKNWSVGVLEYWSGMKEKELENWSDGVSER